jgi:hypothetical protein
MRKLYLLSTVAASLMLVAGTAAAQQSGTTERAPAAQQNAPAEKMAPSMHTGKQHGSSTTGQGSQDMSSGRHGKGATNGQGTSGMSAEQNGQMQQGPKASGKMHTKGEAQKNKNEKTGAKEHNNQNTGMNKSRNKNENTGMNEGKSGSQQSTTSEKGNRSTSGQGAAGTHAKLTSQQRTKITTIIKNKHVRPTHVNFSVRVGARVPTSVHFYTLPTEVVEVYPEWRGYDYILVSDQILIISPRTHEIVAILPA